MRRIFLLLTLLLTASQVMADRTLYFVGDEDNEPESYINAAGEFTGSAVDIIKELAKRLNLKVDIQLTPWVRVLSMIETGKADGGFPLFWTPERDKYALYTEIPVHISVMTAYTKPSRTFEYDDISSLYNKRVGINRGYSISKEFDRAAQEGRITLIEVETVSQLVKMLLDDRIDSIAATPSSIRFYLKETNIVLSEVGQVRARPAYLTLSKIADIKNRDQLLSSINKTLALMKKDGSIDKIRNQHLR